MMTNPRKVAMDSSPSSSSLPVGDEARARYKHQALLQDYQELLRETEAKRSKLQKTTEKKLRLTAEVKFLRKKYKSFARNPCRLKKLPRKMPSTSTDLTSIDQNQRAREAEAPSTCAMFDLNKNAEEMEEIQAEWEPLLKVDKLKRCSVDGGVIARDLNLSVFKDVGNGRSHVGKRKISWQDPVALRV